MILFSAKKSAVHEMHLSAIAEYARRHGLKPEPQVDGFRAIGRMLASRTRLVFSQSSGVASLVVLPLARLTGKRVVHYMHEPTSLRNKLRENPIVKSLVWHAVQWVEMRAASRVLVSRQPLLEQAVDIYGVAPSKLTLAPLLMPQVANPCPGTRRRVTYLGRIDRRRFFLEFLKAAPALAGRGYAPTILTGDIDTLQRYLAEIPEAVQVIAERNFPETLKTRVLAETLCLWNPKRGEVTQSGVTADAVRYGVAILLTDKDPSYVALRDAGIAFEFEAATAANLACLDRIDQSAVAAQAAGIFSHRHGAEAFAKCYLPALT